MYSYPSVNEANFCRVWHFFIIALRPAAARCGLSLLVVEDGREAR